MSNKRDIGLRIRTERERLGLNQGDFAALVGKTRKTLFSYESGAAAPDAEALAAWAEKGVDVLYVVTGICSVNPVTRDAQAGTEKWQRAVRWMARIAKASGIWETLSDQDAAELAMIIYRMLDGSTSKELEGGAVVSILEEWRKRKAG